MNLSALSLSRFADLHRYAHHQPDYGSRSYFPTLDDELIAAGYLIVDGNRIQMAPDLDPEIVDGLLVADSLQERVEHEAAPRLVLDDG